MHSPSLQIAEPLHTTIGRLIPSAFLNSVIPCRGRPLAREKLGQFFYTVLHIRSLRQQRSVDITYDQTDLHPASSCSPRRFLQLMLIIPKEFPVLFDLSDYLYHLFDILLCKKHVKKCYFL